MDKKPNFSEYTTKLALLMNHGFCTINHCLDAAVDFHHKLPNTKLNNKKYPLFVQSIFNCALLCRRHHNNYSSINELKISEPQAEGYEKWLQNFKEKIV